jgi:uncharacterized protein YbcI
MSPRDSPEQSNGEVLTQISDGIVALLKQYYGKGPTHTRTYAQDDLVVCVMRGGITAVEQTLLDAGRADVVRLQRVEFHEVMRDRMSAVVEDATGRCVVGFMSGTQYAPAMVSELFVLAAANNGASEATAEAPPMPPNPVSGH